MDIKNILICGGGMMGKNIAFVFASISKATRNAKSSTISLFG